MKWKKFIFKYRTFLHISTARVGEVDIPVGRMSDTMQVGDASSSSSGSLSLVNEEITFRIAILLLIRLLLDS